MFKEQLSNPLSENLSKQVAPFIQTNTIYIIAPATRWLSVTYTHNAANHSKGEYATDDDEKHEVHVNTMEGFCGVARAVFVKT